MRTCVTVCFAALLLLVSLGSPHAQVPNARQQARELFEQGIALVEEGDFAGAAAAFRKAYALSPHPTVLYNLGQAYVALDRTQAALEVFERCLADPSLDLEPERRAALEEQVDRLRRRLLLGERKKSDSASTFPSSELMGELDVRCPASGVVVFVDNRRMGAGPLKAKLKLTPGLHELRFERRGRVGEVRTVIVRGGESVSEACGLARWSSLSSSSGDTSRLRTLVIYGTAALSAVTLASAFGVYLWNDRRYQAWLEDANVLRNAPPPMTLNQAEAIQHRRNEANAQLTSIQNVDRVTWALLAAGVAALSTATLLRLTREPQVAGATRAGPSGLTIRW